jgi:hypothetical protein
LKELGFPQISHFRWTYYGQPGRHFLIEHHNTEVGETTDLYSHDYLAAPTAEEDLEELPNFVGLVLAGGGRHGQHVAYHVWENVHSRLLNAEFGYKPDRPGMHYTADKVAAEALAKMWCYLRENKVL